MGLKVNKKQAKLWNLYSGPEYSWTISWQGDVTIHKVLSLKPKIVTKVEVMKKVFPKKKSFARTTATKETNR